MSNEMFQSLFYWNDLLSLGSGASGGQPNEVSILVLLE